MSLIPVQFHHLYKSFETRLPPSPIVDAKAL